MEIVSGARMALQVVRQSIFSLFGWGVVSVWKSVVVVIESPLCKGARTSLHRISTVFEGFLPVPCF